MGGKWLEFRRRLFPLSSGFKQYKKSGMHISRENQAFLVPSKRILFYVFFVCKCVLYYWHRVTTQLQLTNISIPYHILYISLYIVSYLSYLIYRILSSHQISYIISYHISSYIYNIIYHIIYHMVSYHIIYRISYHIYHIIYIISCHII